MFLLLGWRRLGGVAIGVALGIAPVGCAARLIRPPGPIECERFMLAAQTALTASADSASVAAPHASAAAMHDYHSCLTSQHAGTASRTPHAAR